MHLRTFAARAVVGVLTAFVASGFQTVVAPTSHALAANVDAPQQSVIPITCTPETYLGSFLYTSAVALLKSQNVKVDPMDIVTTEGSLLDPGYGLGGFTVKVCRVPHYLIRVANQDQVVKSWSTTVAAILADARIEVGDQDTVSPSRDTVMNWKDMPQQITVIRVAESNLTETQPVSFAVQKVNDDSLNIGTNKITQPGVAGVLTIISHLRRENGVLVQKTETSRAVTKKPVDEIIHVGTHNPNSATVVASFYDAPEGTVAHPSLPFGTVLTVINPVNGKTVTAKVEDRGPFVKGRGLDLSKKDFAKLGPLAAGTMTVTISW